MNWPCLLLLVACVGGAACDRAPERSGAPVTGPVEGIDLSHHNGRVDWDDLDQAPIEFVYLKATEGTDWKDPAFQDHWRAATARGYQVGAYHFYLLCKPGAAQAQNFIQSVEVRAETLPPAVDLEFSQNCDPLGEAGAWRSELDDFLSRLEAEYGQRPMIYTTPQFYDRWLTGRYGDYPLWYRTLGDTPPVLSDGRDWDIWQYSMTGRVAGIDGDVDLNQMRARRADSPAQR